MLIELVRESIELMVKKNWLNHINKAIDKYNRLNQKARVQAYVVKKLMERYKEIYGEEISAAPKEK